MKISQANPNSFAKSELRLQIKRFADSVPISDNGNRRLKGKDATGLLSSLLREIHETVLPRVIRVVTDTGHSLNLFVTGRRLVCILRSSNSEEPLTAVTSEMLDQLSDLFSFATWADLQVIHADHERSQSDTGCTALVLATALSIELIKPSVSDPVPEFFATTKPSMSAWVTLDQAGNSLNQGGESTWTLRLGELLKSGLAEIDAQLIQSLASPDHPGCILLNLGDEDRSILAYARSNKSGFMAIMPASDASKVQTCWQECLG